MYSLFWKGNNNMIDFETWDKAVDDFDTYYGIKKARITCIDGKVYEGICNGYYEDEDTKGNAVWAISLGIIKFIQEDVEKIDFID